MSAHYPLASFGLWVARVSACFAFSGHTLTRPIPKNTMRQVYRRIGSRGHWNRMENHTDSISSLFSYSNEHDTPWHWILVRVCTFRISEDSLKPILFRYENFPWLWLRKSRRFYYLIMKWGHSFQIRISRGSDSTTHWKSHPRHFSPRGESVC
jgi:hypothetical protein